MIEGDERWGERKGRIREVGKGRIKQPGREGEKINKKKEKKKMGRGNMGRKEGKKEKGKKGVKSKTI